MKHNIILILLVAICITCIVPVSAATCEQWKYVGKTPWGYIDEYRNGGFTIMGDSLYMVGGSSGSSNPNVVWKSTDGITWDLINTPSPPLNTRSYYVITSFNGYLWLYGGINFEVSLGNMSDIWRSSDGITWNLVNASAVLPGRAWPGFIEYDNKLWILGGTAAPSGMVDWPLFNDTWWSDDGNIWHLANATPAWINRAKPNMVVFNGALWLINGQSAFNKGSNETWYTYDGEIWYPGTITPAYEKRISDTAASFDNKMWVTGGVLNQWSSNIYLNDLWSSDDGVTWTLVNESPLYEPDAFTHLVNFNGNLFYYIGSGNIYQCCASGSCQVEPTPTPCVTPSAVDVTSEVTMNVQGIVQIGIFAAIGVTLLLLVLGFMRR